MARLPRIVIPLSPLKHIHAAAYLKRYTSL